MCGILGGWVPGGLASGIIEHALDQIRHRGPDDSGQFSAGPAFIGMRRLSIIDVKGGHQPIFNEDQSIAVVLNGEIYNYLELIPDLEKKGHQFRTRSDTEVLVHLYEELGSEMCSLLRGMFAFAIMDMRTNKLFLARDRFGKKPLFFAHQNETLLFASELKALRPLAAACQQQLTLRDQSIYDYLSFGVVPQPATIYNEISSVAPASWVEFDGRSLRTKEYWRLEYGPKRDVPYQQAITEVRQHISEAVELRLRSDVPLGVFLSGGVDSSVIAYEASKRVSDLQTFTVKMDSQSFDESPQAVETAKLLGVKNIILPLKVSPLESLQTLVEQYDQPYSDSSAIPSLEVSKLAREHVTVVLNGDGGDELFGGYRRHIAAWRSSQFSWVPSGAAKSLAGFLENFSGARRSPVGFAARFLRGLARTPAERYLAWTTDMLLESDKASVWRGKTCRPTEQQILDTLQQKQHGQVLSGLDQQMYLDTRFNLLNDLIVKIDIANMAYSLEGRSPLLDHVLADYVARLPDDFKVSATRPKRILRDAYQGVLPDGVINGAKRGFEIPLAAWLQGPLREILFDTIGHPNAQIRQWLDPSFVDAILQNRVLQDRNSIHMVYSLLILELWLRNFNKTGVIAA
jgi:asparagine synthase (glutamine-hydrolysing)